MTVAGIASKIDLSALTMQQMKHGIKIVNGKLDKILAEPLESSIESLHQANNYASNRLYPSAFRELQRLLPVVQKAKNYKKGSGISVENFAGYIQASRIQMYARIMIDCYNSKKKMFLPFQTLPSNAKKSTCESVVDLVNKCLEQQKNVETKTMFLQSSSKKSEVQDTIDSLLIVAYPYISELQKWTSMKTSIGADPKSLSIEVMPMYLPEGYEDATEVNLGVIDAKTKVLVKSKLWRTDNKVNASLWGCKTEKKFRDFSKPLDMSLMRTPHFVMSSDGGVEKEYGGLFMGQFEQEDNNDYSYQLSDTVKGQFIPVYCYRVAMKGWFIGESMEDAVVRTKTDTEFVPTDGWEYFKPRDKRGNWRDDPTVTVIAGPMETCQKINNEEVCSD